MRNVFILGLDKYIKESFLEEDATNKDTTLNKVVDIALAREMVSKNAIKDN